MIVLGVGPIDRLQKADLILESLANCSWSALVNQLGLSSSPAE
jgi:hypothetical protein